MVTTLEKRGRLEDAFEASVLADPVTSLRTELREYESDAREAIAEGSVSSVSGNGHSVQFASYGISSLDIAESCRSLLDDFDNASLFLSSCARRGLDPFIVGQDQTSVGTETVTPAVVIDTTERFADMCAVFSIDSADVVGVAVGDKAVFCWLMYHLTPAREAHSDYSLLRT